MCREKVLSGQERQSERGKTYRVQSRSQLIVTSSHKIHETRKQRLRNCRQFFSHSLNPPLNVHRLDLNAKHGKWKIEGVGKLR